MNFLVSKTFVVMQSYLEEERRKRRQSSAPLEFSVKLPAPKSEEDQAMLWEKSEIWSVESTKGANCLWNRRRDKSDSSIVFSFSDETIASMFKITFA